MKINIFYQTGDSFHTREESVNLSLEWQDHAIVEENLQRIKEHYKFSEWISEAERRAYSNKEKHSAKCRRGQFEKERWFRKFSEWDDGTGSLILLTDEGKDFVQQAFWVGFFERLLSAEIKSTKIEF